MFSQRGFSFNIGISTWRVIVEGGNVIYLLFGFVGEILSPDFKIFKLSLQSLSIEVSIGSAPLVVLLFVLEVTREGKRYCYAGLFQCLLKYSRIFFLY